MNIYVFVILIIIAVLGNYVTDCARFGVRGGSFRSGTISSGTRSVGSRISGTVRSSTRFATRSTYLGSSYQQGTWKTADRTLYGLSSYKRRRRYLDSPDSEPTVCFNENNLRNETYGYFICPEDGQSDDMTYCCGDEDAQTCCEYADATALERIIGIVGCVVATAIIVGVVVYCVCIKRRRDAKRKLPPLDFQNQLTGPASVQYNTSQPYSTSQPHGTRQPYSTGVDFQYGQKQGMNSYPQTADGTSIYDTTMSYPQTVDGPNTHDTICNFAVNDGAPPYSSWPNGFESEKSYQTQNNTSMPPPYRTVPYSGFQDVPTEPPPDYP
ncbi:uncharacterized protein LOC123538807 [Mercenaria mercenaria]|uniref:uncharacterized protein LOC123538807 n=1 Tax=Mercenaria mercenaria TaxID=6596 RepID=UPI00234EC6C7|nr:uncharacterized protein LOC123538807 [Mercenaria mercenaria]